MGDKRVTASTAVFTLAPRINAAGRMGSPETAARLLLTADGEEAAALAEDIQQLNVERQAAEAAILGEVLERLKQQPERLAARILVLEGDNWHPGVVGIIASRLMERFGKPCIVLSVQDGVAKGSGRSLPGFSLFDALTACKEVLTAYGGHSLAAGVTLEAARIDEFREAVNAYATAVCPRMPVPELHVDFRMRPSQIDVEKLDLLAALEPCGTGKSRAGLRPVPDAAGQYCAGGRGQAPAAVPVPGGDGCGGHEVSHHAGGFPRALRRNAESGGHAGTQRIPRDGIPLHHHQGRALCRHSAGGTAGGAGQLRPGLPEGEAGRGGSKPCPPEKG